MTLWALPMAFLALTSLLALATHLERDRVRILVRMSVRSRTATPELVEALVAAERAPVLAAHGFQR